MSGPIAERPVTLPSPDRGLWSGLPTAIITSLAFHAVVLAAAFHLAENQTVTEVPVAFAVDIIAVASDPHGRDAEGSSDADAARASAEHAMVAGDAGSATPVDATPVARPDERPPTIADADEPSSPPPSDPVVRLSADDKAETPTTTAAPPAPAPPPPPRWKPATDKSTVAAANTARRHARVRTDARQRSQPSAEPPARLPMSTPDGSRADLGASTAAANPGAGAAAARSGPRFQAGAPGNPLPDYPERARRWGYQGRVILAVRVSADGRPLSVDVASSSGHSILDRSALETVRRWRFRPSAGRAGDEVSLVNVPITFRLTD